MPREINTDTGGNLLDLPDELVYAILGNLRGHDLAKVSQVCERLRAISGTATLWRAACLNEPQLPFREVCAAKQAERLISPAYWRVCFRLLHSRSSLQVCPGCLRTVHSRARDPTVLPICLFMRREQLASAAFNPALVSPPSTVLSH